MKHHIKLVLLVTTIMTFFCITSSFATSAVAAVPSKPKSKTTSTNPEHQKIDQLIEELKKSEYAYVESLSTLVKNPQKDFYLAQQLLALIVSQKNAEEDKEPPYLNSAKELLNSTIKTAFGEATKEGTLLDQWKKIQALEKGFKFIQAAYDKFYSDRTFNEDMRFAISNANSEVFSKTDGFYWNVLSKKECLAELESLITQGKLAEVQALVLTTLRSQRQNLGTGMADHAITFLSKTAPNPNVLFQSMLVEKTKDGDPYYSSEVTVALAWKLAEASDVTDKENARSVIREQFEYLRNSDELNSQVEQLQLALRYGRVFSNDASYVTGIVTTIYEKWMPSLFTVDNFIRDLFQAKVSKETVTDFGKYAILASENATPPIERTYAQLEKASGMIYSFNVIPNTHNAEPTAMKQFWSDIKTKSKVARTRTCATLILAGYQPLLESDIQLLNSQVNDLFKFENFRELLMLFFPIWDNAQNKGTIKSFLDSIIKDRKGETTSTAKRLLGELEKSDKK